MDRPKKTLIAIIAAAIVAAAIIVLYFVDPSQSLLMPKCWFYTFTGYKCPGCGTLRATYSLLHLDIVQALRYNYFLLISLPMLLLVAYATYSRTALAQRLQKYVLSAGAMFIFAALILLWWIARNIFSL